MADMKEATGRQLDLFAVADQGAVAWTLQSTLVPVSTCACPPFDSSVGITHGTILGGTAKLGDLAIRTFYGIRLDFSNVYTGLGNT
ncbi:hypothetical protein BWL13_02447 [Microbacterium oleivorans]|uniref:hypothetical protein n=1 Tax=Microbacterium oleivorans TaxID=273677 RepID=UPI000978ADC2|nr:hypothetical protein [Microbacterium oleivorans]AZS44850.1 hypothetical protein BWL13_02447 [Microbacterium oleivorans]